MSELTPEQIALVEKHLENNTPFMTETHLPTLTMSKPVINKWKIFIFGKGDNTVVVLTPQGVNWFNRLMTSLIFGWYWEKL